MTTKNRFISTTSRFRSFWPAAAGFGLLLTIVLWACTKKEIRTVSVPSITGVNKMILHVGDTLVITGSGFSAVPADNLVAIASTSLTVVQASSGQLEAVVPNTAKGGQLTVGFAGGRTAVFPENIQIIGGVQPYINSIVPTVVYTGDTVVVHGGNFGTPASTNDVVIGGITCNLLNATDSILRISIPDMAHSGPLTVTTNGATSLPINFTVLRPNPLADGRIYWVYGYQSCCYPNSTVVFRGTDSAFSFPYGTAQYTNNSTDEIFTGYGSSLLGSGTDPLQGDLQGNHYYLYNLAGLYGSTTNHYQLIRLSSSNGSLSRTVVWDNDYGDNVGGDTYYTNPSDSTMYAYVSRVPDQPAIDGNTMYIKLGISNSYLKADLSGSPISFTTVAGLVPDSLSYNMQFGANTIFYKTLGSQYGYQLDLVAGVNYVPRGGGITHTVPLPTPEQVVNVLADNSHGDTALIVTQTIVGQNGYAKVYRFNAATQELRLLYGPDNWGDALGAAYGNIISGWLWAGPHIYYASTIRNKGVSNGVYLLNDDGSSTRAFNVYPRLDPASAIDAVTSVPMFIGKN